MYACIVCICISHLKSAPVIGLLIALKVITIHPNKKAWNSSVIIKSSFCKLNIDKIC